MKVFGRLIGRVWEDEFDDQRY